MWLARKRGPLGPLLSSVLSLSLSLVADVPTLPANFEQDAWSRISRAIQAIHSQSPLADVKEGLYRVSTSCREGKRGETS